MDYIAICQSNYPCDYDNGYYGDVPTLGPRDRNLIVRSDTLPKDGVHISF